MKISNDFILREIAGEYILVPAGAAAVTLLELATGLIVNRWLGWNVWDYSDMPLNFMGQICLPFTLLWFPVSGAAIFTEDWLRLRLFGERPAPYRWL